MRWQSTRSCRSGIRALSGRVDSSQLTFGRSDIAFAKPPLPAFFECRHDIAARKFVHRVRADVEQERNLPRIQKYVVSIGHRQSNKTAFRIRR